MVIKKVHIFGFGKWTNQTFTFNPTITRIEGPNESGKTSLKQFMIYVLFDLPLQLKRQYEPKHGTIFGGQVYIQHKEKGTVIIERISDKRKGKAVCLLEDGTEQGEEFLATLLNNMNRHTFESVFSFDDQELQKLQFIKEDDLGKVLFGIGLSGSDKITRLEENLAKQMEHWFRKKGKKPIINNQILIMREMKDKIATLEEKEEHYNDLQLKKNELLSTINELKSDITNKEKKVNQLQKYTQVKEAIIRYQAIEEKLLEYEDITSFPNMGLDRLRQLKELLLPIESEIHSLMNKVEEIKKQEEEIQSEIVNAQVYEELQKVDKHYEELRFLNKQLEEKEKELGTLEIAFVNGSEGIDFGTPKTTLSAYHIPMFTEDKWKTLAKHDEELYADMEHLKNEEQRLFQMLEETKGKIQETQEELIPSHKYDDIKNQIEEHTQSKWKEAFFTEQLKKQESNRKLIEKQASQLAIISNLALLLGLFCLIGATVYSFLSTNYSFMLWGGVSSLVFFLSFFIIKVNARSLRLKIQHQSEHLPKEDIIPEQDIDLMKRRLEKHEQNVLNLKEYKEKATQIEQDIEFVKDKQKENNRKLALLDEQVLEEQEKYPFLSNIELRYWPSFYHTLVKLQKDEKVIQEKTRQVSAIKERMCLLDTKGRSILKLCNVEENNEDNLWDMLQKLKSSEEEKRNQIERLNTEQLELTNKIKLLNNQLIPYTEQLGNLYKLANVENEEQFLAKGIRYEEKQQLLAKQQEWMEHVRLVFEEKVQAIIEEKIVWDELETLKNNLIKELQEDKQVLETYRQKLADYKAILIQLEENEHLSELRHEYALLQNELKNQVRHWMTLKVAESFLKKTKQIYQDDYLPEIINRASDYFSRLTEGRYVQMIPPTEERGFLVESVDHVRFSINELSSGATAQAYISIRLALSEVMNTSFDLPFLIDDAFVHFDKTRKKEMHDILDELCHKQQVIYFTCNEQMSANETSEEMIFLNQSTISAR